MTWYWTERWRRWWALGEVGLAWGSEKEVVAAVVLVVFDPVY